MNYKTDDEQLIERLFSESGISEDELEEIRMWLVEDGNDAIHGEALRKKFIDMYTYEEEPKYAVEMWPELAERLGLDVNLVNALISGKTVQVPLYRRIAFQVAAVLIPLLVIGSTLGWLFYKTGDTTDRKAAETVMIAVTDRDEQEVILPDSSRIVVKPGSVITYAENFKENRSVTLSGEAFFSVTKDANHPFTVESGGMKIAVLGTEFIVKAYEDLPNREVVLASGKVSVSTDSRSITLEPMQRMRLNKNENTIEIDNIGEGELMRLRGINLHFNETPLDEAFKTISSYFNINIIIAQQMDLTERVNVLFDHDTPLEEVLDILQTAYPKFNFKIYGDTLTIQPR